MIDTTNWQERHDKIVKLQSEILFLKEQITETHKMNKQNARKRYALLLKKRLRLALPIFIISGTCVNGCKFVRGDAPVIIDDVEKTKRIETIIESNGYVHKQDFYKYVHLDDQNFLRFESKYIPSDDGYIRNYEEYFDVAEEDVIKMISTLDYVDAMTLCDILGNPDVTYIEKFAGDTHYFEQENNYSSFEAHYFTEDKNDVILSEEGEHDNDNSDMILLMVNGVLVACYIVCFFKKILNILIMMKF